MRAPFAGTVIAKHLTLGEKVTDEDDSFTVADLASVWVDFHAPQDNLAQIRKGQEVQMHAEHGLPDAQTTIVYVAPIVDDKTQTGVVRIVLPNPEGRWRPGLFVCGQVLASQSRVDVLIPKDAVQTVKDQSVVFLPEEGGFEAHPIRLGRSNKTHVEVVSGLTPGQEFVQSGSFELKAKLVTSGLGAHAGHGH
jgi:cobalt-zinc-cadmium efflux system membrane fusion protein